MKRSIICFFIFCPFFLFAQKEITTKWFSNTYDTFLIDKTRWKSCIPYDILEPDNDNVVLATFDFRAWTLRSLNKKTGKINWLNARTADYPDTTRQKYYFDNMYLRQNGDIDVYGIKSHNNSPSASYGDGNPIKITYDSKTGKEKKVYFPEQANGKFDNIVKLGSYSGYIPNDNPKGFYYLDRTLYSSTTSFMLYRLDSNLIIRDTLTRIYDGKDPNNDLVQVYDITRPHKINNNIYYLSGVWKGYVDTTLQILFYKINANGKIETKRQIGTSLYNNISYIHCKNISDGYLISGYVDTTANNFFKNPTKASNSSMTAKVDTNGNILWKSFLVKPEKGIMNCLASCEDKKRGGYWVLASDLNNDLSPFLYFIDNKGKSTFVTNITFGDSPDFLFPHNLWTLKDGSLFVAFGYKAAQKDYAKAKAAWGVSLIEAAELDKILATSEPDILPSFLVNIYPNPAHEALNVSVAESDEPLQIECFDLQGRAIYRCDFQSFTQINTSDWQRGLYAYTIRDTRGRLVKSDKVIIE
jgi:hypothetical protein